MEEKHNSMETEKAHAKGNNHVNDDAIVLKSRLVKLLTSVVTHKLYVLREEEHHLGEIEYTNGSNINFEDDEEEREIKYNYEEEGLLLSGVVSHSLAATLDGGSAVSTISVVPNYTSLVIAILKDFVPTEIAASTSSDLNATILYGQTLGFEIEGFQRDMEVIIRGNGGHDVKK
ncbi:hypothetical protein L1887_03692 [Cichorium endivia]|nr:hypothetical protein L1887_03692 [Cichorium endivia]